MVHTKLSLKKGVIVQKEVPRKLFGVYLLISQNDKYKGRIYIGFTVNPQRRIIQHNRGKNHEGARKTSGKGPWDMVVMVHGFPNEIAALRFEWAWQHPYKSRILRFSNVGKRKDVESEFSYRVRIMNAMLHIGPWFRLPLLIHIMASQYITKIKALISYIPSHMKITEGPMEDLFQTTNYNDMISFAQGQIRCTFCSSMIEITAPGVFCCMNTCNMVAHLFCLANFMLKKCKQVIPTEGTCPKCFSSIHYGQIISHQLFIK